MSPNGSTTAPETTPEVIILIMGMTGSGKSSFIKHITGDDGIKIGHGVSSETSDIGVHSWIARDGRRCTLVDTPGFDDSNGMTDTDVLDKIANFLVATYGEINGLIYCQRIDVKAGGLTIRNLRMFEKVCGLALKNAAIVTTYWDVVGGEKAVELEQELVTEQRYFKPLCDAGANTFGHNNTHESAQRVMNKLLNNNPIVLQMQEELKEPGVTLEQTSAGSQLSNDLAAMIKKYEAEMKKVREEMEEAVKAKDKALQKELKDEFEKLKEDKTKAAESKEALKKPPSKPGFFERFMIAGREGAKQCGLFGMVGGLTAATVAEGYHVAKIAKAVVVPGKKVREAENEYHREWNHVVTEVVSTGDPGKNKIARACGGAAGFFSGASDVLHNRVDKPE